MASKIFPSPKGTDMVIAEEIAKQPIAAEIREKNLHESAGSAKSYLNQINGIETT